jgi:hypothetical protein
MNDRLAEGLPESGGRKSYDPPRLEVYGDLSRLTANVGTLGKNDGGMAGNDKTV